ncbi:hypothetical protein BDK51DRAFT_50897 [Blyttiomyces helicus]|uniref:Uncharacterized protein n=1 Tax=Blyttiomyces helicus TaxID=388810 RepID=A0A4P9WN51_9FUNG|nr:hypothetical protein BDK51DRAFT_50897 [Blyttiomyces helicus]|eukprot:RKO93483.1 hypothetical protein BDK51DRAFT_50897 [Blyttiomyces helicus]
MADGLRGTDNLWAHGKLPQGSSATPHPHPQLRRGVHPNLADIGPIQRPLPITHNSTPPPLLSSALGHQLGPSNFSCGPPFRSPCPFFTLSRSLTTPAHPPRTPSLVIPAPFKLRPSPPTFNCPLIFHQGPCACGPPHASAVTPTTCPARTGFSNSEPAAPPIRAYPQPPPSAKPTPSLSCERLPRTSLDPCTQPFPGPAAFLQTLACPDALVVSYRSGSYLD